MADPAYVPPPPFAPPQLRVPPLNETAVLGQTSYPYRPPPPIAYGYVRPPAAPTTSWYPVSGWQPGPVDSSARRRRRVSVLMAMAVVTALVAICAVLLAGEPGGGNHARSLSLPNSVDGYTRVGTLTGAQVRSIFPAGGGALGSIASDDLTGARVGVYATLDDSGPSMLFIGFTGHDSPSLGAQLRAAPAGTVAEQVLTGAGAAHGATSVDAGPLGGAMRCATVAIDGQDASVGVWADTDTLGIVVLVVDPATSSGTTPTAASTGSVTRDFRAKAEH
jgi:hypothetical protein